MGVSGLVVGLLLAVSPVESDLGQADHKFMRRAAGNT
jgi:hypothetical protein